MPIEKIKEFSPVGKHFGFAIEIDNLDQVGYRTPESWLNPILHLNFLNKLYEWHFDIHGGIGTWAIDINTLNKK